jgi:hypothetical protein
VAGSRENHGFHAVVQNGPAASELPSDRHPDRTKHAVVLEAVKVWPGKGGVRRKVGATANLDSSCARRLCDTAGRGEVMGFQVEQRNWVEGKKEKIACREFSA